MGLVFIPFYVKYLGIEAYGLIGIFAILQAWLAVLDMGMAPALSHEMARFSGGAHSSRSISNLLRTDEIIGISLAVSVALGIWTTSDWLASDWVKVDKTPLDAVAHAFSIMGVVVSLRFIENIYRSSLIGLQKQLILNVIISAMATLRGIGAVGILAWVSPSVDAFFIWQGIVSAMTVVAFIYTALYVFQCQ